MATAPMTRVKIAPGRTVYRGPGSHPFRAGDAIDLPADHAAQLAAAGHVLAEMAAAAEPAAIHAQAETSAELSSH